MLPAEVIDGAHAVLKAKFRDAVAGVDRAEHLVRAAHVDLPQHPFGRRVAIEEKHHVEHMRARVGEIVPGAVQAQQAADGAAVEQRLGLRQRQVEPALVVDRKQDAVLPANPVHPQTGVPVDVHGLLAQDHPRLERRHTAHHPGVQVGPEAHAHHVGPDHPHHLAVIGKDRRGGIVLRHERLGVFTAEVGHGGQGAAAGPGVAGHVPVGHAEAGGPLGAAGFAAADHGNFQKGRSAGGHRATV